MVRHQAAVVAVAMVAGLVVHGGCQRAQTATVPDVDERVRAAQALCLEAQEADQDGRPTRAIGLYQEALRTYRDFPAGWNNLGVLLMEQGRNMEAFEAFQTAAALSPTDARSLANVGMLWQRLGYQVDAIKAYDQALQRDKNYLPALRESVVLETQVNQVTPTTAERVRRALLLETDLAWKAELERQKLLVDERLAMVGKDSGANP